MDCKRISEEAWNWLDWYVNQSSEPNVRDIDQLLTNHLVAKELLPASAPCGCCVFLGAQVSVGRRVEVVLVRRWEGDALH